MVHGLNIENPYPYDISVKMLDGDLDKVVAVDRTPDGGSVIGGMNSGRPVHTDFLPTKMQWGGSEFRVPDFDRHHLVNISARAKGVIESLEPGTHQFVPIDCYHPEGEHLEQRFVMIPCNRIDSVDHDRTTFILFRGRMWRTARHLMRRHQEAIPPDFDINVEPKLVFSKTKIAHRHLWVDKHMNLGEKWISQELADAFITAGLTGLGLGSGQEIS